MACSTRIIQGAVCLAWMLFPGGMSAQTSAWASFVEEWRRTPRPPLSLLASKGLVTATYRASDEQLVRLVATYDLAAADLEGPSLDRVRAARNWDLGPHWILLDREGKVLDEGSVLPSGTKLRDHLVAAGGTPSWEALNRFLEQHPDHGEALQQRMAFACAMTRYRFRALRERGQADGVQISDDFRWPVLIPARAKDPTATAGLAREVGETLRGLNQLPDAWRGNWVWLTSWLDLLGSLDPDSIRSELGAFQDGIFEAWRSNPHSGSSFQLSDETGTLGLADVWMACDDLGNARSHLADACSLSPTPGRVWPSSDLLHRISARALQRGQARDLLAVLGGLEADPSQGVNQREWTVFRGAALYWRTVALAQLGRWPEASSSVQECRQEMGTFWGAVTGNLSHHFGPPAGDRSAEPIKPGQAPQSFLDLLTLPPLDPPPVPASKPLRFLVWGSPAWKERWRELRQAQPLGDWGPDELREEAPTEADTAYLQRLGFPAVGWAVFRGTAELVSRGDGLPDPPALALHLASVAPSRLQVLDTFLRWHPEHLDARRERFDLLRPRTPSVAFEERLIEDAALAGVPLDFGPEAPWIRNVAGWQRRARRLLPELEAALHRWPGNAALWRQWVDWAAFLPAPPSTIALAESLPVFGSHSAWKAGLPAAAHKAIATEFLRGRRYEEMADWFLEAWRGVLERTLESRTSPPPKAQSQDAAIYESLCAALKPLGRAGDLKAVDQAWIKVRRKAGEKSP
ncbi:hypothetical protein [Geothrix paludis]|uniref:hypothetical protein n=1 Tax=Geothrix paludis TaxID=2922722 RepID=UPI001FAC0CE5|nr:hypothetical protein [Geothrix paludis]